MEHCCQVVRRKDNDLLFNNYFIDAVKEFIPFARARVHRAIIGILERRFKDHIGQE